MIKILSSLIIKKIILLFTAMVPIIELRGAIPLGVAWGINPWEAMIISIIGSTLPVPFLILTFRYILKWIKSNKYLYKFGNFLDNHVAKKAKKMSNFTMIGLILFVGVPIPSTGAYSGAMIASILNMSFKRSFIGILIGNIIAGLIMMTVSHQIIL